MKLNKNKGLISTLFVFLAVALSASAQTSVADFDAAVYAQEIADKLLAILNIIVPIVVAVLGLRIAFRWIKRWFSAA